VCNSMREDGKEGDQQDIAEQVWRQGALRPRALAGAANLTLLDSSKAITPPQAAPPGDLLADMSKNRQTEMHGSSISTG
jgi:hypothetical protein